MITVYPSQLYADSTGALIIFTGPPNRAVAWSLAAGDGTLTPISSFTDAAGRAAAKYVPGTAGTTPRIEVQYGA